MPWASKSTAQAKKVAPPAIPLDSYTSNKLSSLSNAGSDNIPNNSSVDDGGLLHSKDPTVFRNKDNIMEYGFTNVPKMPPNLNPNAFVGREPLTHKAAVYYHQQLALQEDQGIDLAQSPGRDSPSSSSGSAGSGSRHSTASLDSGRASSYVPGCGTSTRGPFSSPRCSSVSSCSIGSFDRISQRSENDIILDWLSDLKFEDYLPLFTAAGYDLPTITRMTPEDLTAIGITNPQHRERVKRHIEKLHIADNLPDFVPSSIEEWLRLLGLEEYIQPLLDQNYKTVGDATQITWEDLEDIGIVKLGHQKKILLAIKRVKDILSGKRGGPNASSHQYNQKTVPPLSPMGHLSWNDTIMPQEPYIGSNENESDKNIVLIKVRQPRGKSLESLEDVNERNTRTYLTFSHYSTGDATYYPQQYMSHNKTGLNPNYVYPHGNVTWRRSYDDGDITPTNEPVHHDQCGGTLPRQRGANLSRSQVGERNFTNDSSSESSQHAITIPDYNVLCDTHPELAYVSNKQFGNYANVINKKIAPDPPKRNCSIRSNRGFIPDPNTDTGHSCYIMPAGPQQQHIPSNYAHPIYVNFSAIHQTKAEVHCEHPYDNKSDSSIDSIDTIPFANENTGTIKQKLYKQDIVSTLSLSSSSSSSSTNTIANVTQSLTSLKLSPSLQSPYLASDDAQCEEMLEMLSTENVDMLAPSCSATDSNISISETVTNQSDSLNVLNDIGNMLANLTDELDAMLEEEKRVGINDSE